MIQVSAAHTSSRTPRLAFLAPYASDLSLSNAPSYLHVERVFGFPVLFDLHNRGTKSDGDSYERLMIDAFEQFASAIDDRYRLQHAVGEGAMATVFLAEDVKHRRKVAVKVLKPELSATLGHERFAREIEIAANLTHPHILPVHDSGEAGGFLYYVMPYIEGESLRRRLERDGRLSVDEALHLTDQVAAALDYAHERGVIHRDIKPENILLTGDQAIVADFGIARAVEAAGDQRLTGTGMAVGTPAYMSPEQAYGEEGVDGRSDVYALGCVVYEMLAGTPPFEGATAAALLARHAVDQAPSLSTRAPDVPVPVAQAVELALAKDRARRFATPRIFAAALRGQVAPGPDRRRVLRVLGPTIAGLIVLAAVGWFLLSLTGGATIEDRSLAVLPFEAVGRERPTAFTDGVHGDLLTRLATVADLSVTSRTSVMRFRQPDRPLRDIAEELGVSWVLTGEVQESADEVQVQARLVNARTDRQVWARSYRRELTAASLFALQSEITTEIARELETQLSAAEQRQVARAPTDNLDAYRLYIEGRTYLDQRTEEGMERAITFFDRALARDSSYALAWVGLADALLLLEDYGHAEAGSHLPRAREATDRALDLDPTLAEAHASLGLLHSRLREGGAALDQLNRAVELQPSYAEAHNWLGWNHSVLGNATEALESSRRAVALDPLSPEAVSNLALGHLINGDFRRALEESQRIRQLQSDWSTTVFYESLSLYHLGRYGDAIERLENLEVPWAGQGPAATLALARLASGDTTGANALLSELEAAGSPFDVGIVRAGLGETGAALEAFERVDRWEYWPSIAIHHLFPNVLDSVRADARYAGVMDRARRSWGVTDEQD